MPRSVAPTSHFSPVLLGESSPVIRPMSRTVPNDKLTGGSAVGVGSDMEVVSDLFDIDMDDESHSEGCDELSDICEAECEMLSEGISDRNSDSTFD